MTGAGDPSKRRLDVVLVERGLMPTRAKAKAAIEAGLVSVDGGVVRKPSDLVAPDARIAAEAPHPWVSRGGVKLAAALDAFGVDPAGRECLDIGASTGGFTEVLLTRGARRVTAVDVGHGQLHPRVAGDPRVVVRERTDARALSPEDFAARPSLLVADVSFVSVLKVIAAPLRCLAPGADVVLLIKPQFEAGRDKIGKGGLVAADDAETARDTVVARLATDFALEVGGVIDSPITGGDGNREYLVHAWRR